MNQTTLIKEMKRVLPMLTRREIVETIRKDRKRTAARLLKKQKSR